MSAMSIGLLTAPENLPLILALIAIVWPVGGFILLRAMVRRADREEGSRQPLPLSARWRIDLKRTV
jgi:hypothetical protein